MATRVADEVGEIKKRQAELALEREMADNVDVATGIWLDMHGNKVGLKRVNYEADSSYRTRVKNAMK